MHLIYGIHFIKGIGKYHNYDLISSLLDLLDLFLRLHL